jgi:hypothetical protein
MNKLLLAVVASIAVVAVAATSMKLVDKDIIMNMANLLVLITILSPCICTLVFLL